MERWKIQGFTVSVCILLQNTLFVCEYRYLRDTMDKSDFPPASLGKSLGIEAVADSGEGGKAVLHCRATMAMCHSGGIVQGGFVTGWIDAAMAHVVIAQTKH